MEEASLHTTRKHLFIFTQYYDKHGVPPTKRLFKVAMLDPSPEFIGPWGTSGDPGLPIVVRPLQSSYSEWSTPAGLKLARENLQSRVKEEDSITDVENAVFDLGVMDSLCFLFVDQRVFIGMITKFIKFIELNFSVISRGFDIKVCMLKGPDCPQLQQSLASHMEFEGKSQSEQAIKIGPQASVAHRLVMVLPERVPEPEVEAVLEVTNLESMSVKLAIVFASFGTPMCFEDQELGKTGVDNLGTEENREVEFDFGEHMSR
ncbi:hypothetical protein Tco_0592867 [Tanacetum coccineum]